jgi:hypothetical protein
LADGVIESLGSQIRTSCDRPGGGDEIRGLDWEYRDVPPCGALMQTLDRRCQLARRREQQPGPEQLVGQVLDIVSHVADIADGVPKVR